MKDKDFVEGEKGWKISSEGFVQTNLQNDEDAKAPSIMRTGNILIISDRVYVNLDNVETVHISKDNKAVIINDKNSISL